VLNSGMAKRTKRKTSAVPYKGVPIRLYPHRDRWKATFQLHGHPRTECYGTTQAAAQRVAEAAITSKLDPNTIAAGNDENTARALLDEHGVSLTEAARLWLAKTPNRYVKLP